MREPKNPHFYDFGFFEPVTKPQNQLFIFGDTRISEKNNKNLEHLFEMLFRKFQKWISNVDNFRKDEHPKIMKIR